MWNTYERNVAEKGITFAALVEGEDLEQILNKYSEVKDKETFYVTTCLIMKIAEYYTFFDANKKEELLLLAREKIKKELENDPKNIDLLELLAVNDFILYHTYEDGGPYNSKTYEDVKNDGRREIKNLADKWIKIMDEIEDRHEYFLKLSKEPKTVTSIFKYGGWGESEKKKKIKRITDLIHNYMIFFEHSRDTIEKNYGIKIEKKSRYKYE